MSIAEWMTADLWRGVQEFSEQYPTLDGRAVAERFVRAMSADQRRSALVEAVLAIVDGHRLSRERARVRAIEAEASWPARRAEFEAERVARVAEYEAEPRHAPRNTRAYKRWAATDEGQGLLALEAEAAARDAEEQRLYDEDRPAWEERFGLRGLLHRFEEDVRLKVTAELLAATFAVGDGRTVTWGQATIRDHMIRIGMLRGQMTGTGDAIARHEAAMSMITASGAACLNELQVAA